MSFSPSSPTLAREKGDLLELATKLYFERDRQVEEVFSWAEYAARHGFTIQDTGIDLVAIQGDEAWAIQCKNWERELDWGHLGSFVGSLSQKDLPFKGGYLVAQSLTTRAERTLNTLEKPVILLPAAEILERYEALAQKLLKGEREALLPPIKKTLRPYQLQAIEALLKGFETHTRGKLLMPPGTGKTLVSLRFTEKLFQERLQNPSPTDSHLPPLVLFLCPSIALLDQTIKVWLREKQVPLQIAAVVSDKTVGKDEELNQRSLLSFPATTDPAELRTRFTFRPGRLHVIFSTYQSLEVVMEAQAQGFPAFDLVICDEAHRTAGISDRRGDEAEGGFRLVHDEEKLRAYRRLYMTATPRVFDASPDKRRQVEEQEMVKIYDMSDETLFGPTFYEYTFRQAIEEGYLVPYRIVIMVLDQKQVQEKLYAYLNSDQALSVDLATQLVGLAHLIRGEVKDEEERPLPHPVKSGIVFVSRVQKSQKLEREFRRVYEEFFGEAPRARLLHIDGQMSAFEKRRRLDWLREASLQEPHFLSNAKVLTEGIDVPSLDAVAFLDPKDSVVDIIQALGRVVRKAEGKSYGLIFLPLLVNSQASIDRQFEQSSYKALWQVLGAIASLDKTFMVRMRAFLLREKDRPATDEPALTIHRTVWIQPELFQEVRQHLKLRIVRSYGLESKAFLSDWARETATLAQTLHTHLDTALQQDSEFQQQFQHLLAALQTTLHQQIAPTDARSFIVQYLLTRPIFQALFHRSETPSHSPLALLDKIFLSFQKFLQNNLQPLEEFYKNVSLKAQSLTSETERQDFLRYLYTNFFSIAFRDTVEEMGIAYTPPPLVEFILDFGDYLCRKHWGKSWKEPGLALWEPFAGTGTFLALAMERIPPHHLSQKLQQAEIWATEKLLLPFLILVTNLEDRLQHRLSAPHPFQTALWADTFQLMEHFYQKSTPTLPGLFPQEIQTQFERFLQTPIHFILSNPPWRAGRENENLGRQNLTYPHLRRRIETTYAHQAKNLGATLVNSLYDTYIQAIRMASDRIQEGLIAFVLNNGWLTGLAARGLRKCLQEEFSEIYLYDLKGDARTRGEEWKKQGDKIFESQSRAGVCLAFFVKKAPKESPQARIYYTAVPDYASREEKFNALQKAAQNPASIPWQTLHPNPTADWLMQGDPSFKTLIKLGDKKNPQELTVFEIYSRGATTCRDNYAYNFSREELEKHMSRLIDHFNQHLVRVRKREITRDNLESQIEKDPRKIKWDSLLKNRLFTVKAFQKFDPQKVRLAYYRPFVPIWMYSDTIFISHLGFLPSFFPAPDSPNVAIVVTAVGKGGIFDAAVVDRIVDLHYFSAQNQLFPLYYYDKDGQRRENITDGAVAYFRRELGDGGIGREDIFYYVFGVLSTPGYVARYRENLVMELPRVPVLRRFREVVELGRELAELQLGYEQLAPYEGVPGLEETLQQAADEPLLKARLDEKSRSLLLNDRHKVGPLPDFAIQHQVGNYPPLRWISEYLVPSTDKETGIEWQPGYTIGRFLDLARRLLTLSQKSLEIKARLDKLF